MDLGFCRLNARKLASLRGVTQKCARKVSKSGVTAGVFEAGKPTAVQVQVSSATHR